MGAWYWFPRSVIMGLGGSQGAAQGGRVRASEAVQCRTAEPPTPSHKTHLGREEGSGVSELRKQLMNQCMIRAPSLQHRLLLLCAASWSVPPPEGMRGESKLWAAGDSMFAEEILAARGIHAVLAVRGPPKSCPGP